MTPSALAASSLFVRDRFTWLTYVIFGYFAYMVISLGPILPFLREDLGLSYAAGGLHLSLLSGGGVVAGFYGDRLIGRVGRATMLLAGGSGMAAGALLLATGGHIVLTLAGVLLMGMFGTFLPIVIQAALADHHHEQRDIALTEVNIAAMVGAGLPPLVIWFGEYIGTGWQSAPILAMVAWLPIAALFAQEPVPESLRRADSDATCGAETPGLPWLFWGYWIILFLSVAIEWCISLWSASFFVAVVGIKPAVASVSMTLFFVAMVVGRLASRIMISKISLLHVLLLAEATTLAGFLLLWLGPVAALNMVGLFVAGLGVAGLFPLALTAAIGVAPNRSNTASARLSMAAGLAMLTAPFVLGWLADVAGLVLAFGVVVVLLAMIAGITLGIRAWRG